MSTAKAKFLTLDQTLASMHKLLEEHDEDDLPLRIDTFDPTYCFYCEIDVVQTGVKKPLRRVARGGKPAVVIRDTAFTEQATVKEAIARLTELKSSLGSGEVPVLRHLKGMDLQACQLSTMRISTQHQIRRVSRGGFPGIVVENLTA